VLRQLWQTNRPLTATGLLMLAALMGAAIGLVIDPRMVTGAPVWLKPAKFAVSIAIYTFTLAWIFSVIPEWPKVRRVVGWTTAMTLLLEMALIALQAFRGTTSHFNIGTIFDAVVFATMGAAIVVQTLSAVAVAVALWRHRFGDAALGWALRLGITITILGAMTGGLMTRPTRQQLDQAHAGQRITIAGAHTVGAPDGGPGLPGTGWSTEHGDLRVAHFLGLHALQALPLFALALGRRRLSDVVRVRLTIIVAASYIGIFGILLSQALRGQSILAPDALTVTIVLVWGVTTTAALAVVALRRSLTHSAAVI
jgi:hypothetical protein